MESIFRIDPELNIPIYRQLTDSIRSAVKKGLLSSGQQLPTVQELSTRLGVARGTIKRAYDELERAGFVYTVPAKGCFVAPRNVELLREEHLRRIEEHLREAAALQVQHSRSLPRL